MILSSDGPLLADYVNKMEGNEDAIDEDDEDDEDDEEDEDEPAVTGRKRKVTKTTARGRPAKKAKAPSPGLKFHIFWRGRETGEDEIQAPEQGTIKFSDKNYTKFTGEIDLPFVGDNVEFTGEKVSDKSNARGSSWNEYCEAEYEQARMSRWF